MTRVGFLRSGLTLAILKDAGIRPEVREELMRALGGRARPQSQLCPPWTDKPFFFFLTDD